MSDAVREQDPAVGGQAVDQNARSAEPPVLTEADVVEDLRRQLAEAESGLSEKDAEARRERDRAGSEARARQAAEARAHAAETAGQQSTAAAQLDAISNSLTSHQSQMTSLQGKIEGAFAEGDFTAAAKLQTEMAILGGRIVNLEDGKAELEARIAATTQTAGRQPDARQQGDARESFIRQQPPRIQDWLRTDKGERFFTDSAFQTRVSAAAKFASEVKGIGIDTAEYIDYIEEQVGLREQQQQAATVTRTETGGQPAAAARGRDAEDRRMVAAPAGGSTGGSVRTNAAGNTEVYLTPTEKEQARRDGVSESEWARHKRDLMNENLIGPSARNR